MDNQILLNVLISLIIGISISYYYLRKFNYKFLFYSIVIFLFVFIILYYLGPKKNTYIESFSSEENCNCPDDEKNNNSNDGENNDGENNDSGNNDGENNDSENNDSENMNYDESEENILNEENTQEEFNQEELLNNQEEYIKQSIEEEVEEEDNHDLLKKIAKKKVLDNHLLNKGLGMGGSNNQFNPGIGVGISPVNIYINGDETSVDKFKNKKIKKNNQPIQNNEINDGACSDNYFKQASRIYNNCDWAQDKKQWCNDTYNYDKNCGAMNDLLPCKKNPVTNIPQTLNNLVNTKKTIKNGEPCPLEINQPWSNYKTGDDKETNEIAGFNL